MGGYGRGRADGADAKTKKTKAPVGCGAERTIRRYGNRTSFVRAPLRAAPPGRGQTNSVETGLSE